MLLLFLHTYSIRINECLLAFSVHLNAQAFSSLTDIDLFWGFLYGS